MQGNITETLSFNGGTLKAAARMSLIRYLLRKCHLPPGEGFIGRPRGAAPTSLRDSPQTVVAIRSFLRLPPGHGFGRIGNPSSAALTQRVGNDIIKAGADSVSVGAQTESSCRKDLRQEEGTP